MSTLKCPICKYTPTDIIRVSRCRGTVYDHVSLSEDGKSYSCQREELDESTLTFMCYRCAECGWEAYGLDCFIVENE